MNFNENTRSGRINLMSLIWSYGLLSVGGCVWTSIKSPHNASWIWLPWMLGTLILALLVCATYIYIDEGEPDVKRPTPLP